MIASRICALCTLLVAVSASPVTILEERQSQQVNIQVSLSESKFRSLEDPNTLKAYLQAAGYNYNFNYKQLSQAVVAVDQYFAQKASQTTSTTADYGFPLNAPVPQTTTRSTTPLQGGPSFTNNSANAAQNLVSVFSFSDGNAACAGGSIQRTTTTSSTASSGSGNSTALVQGGRNVNRIDVTSSVPGASDNRVVNGSPQDALTANDCAAASSGASARSSVISSLTIPVNVTSPAQGVNHVASSFCEAGVSRNNQGTSISSAQGALTNGGVAAVVTCNGVQSRGTPVVVFGVAIQGSYGSNTGFAGTVVASRTASVSISCT